MPGMTTSDITRSMGGEVGTNFNAVAPSVARSTSHPDFTSV
jgi:hypothetical protein